MQISGTHILVFPYPAQGHMLSLLDLTHQLAIRGVYITILVTPKNLPSLASLLSAHPTTITTLVLPLPPHPGNPSGIENVKDLPMSGFSAMMVALGDLYKPVLTWARNHSNPPSAILSDFFLGWTNRLAKELGIRRYCYSPSVYRSYVEGDPTSEFIKEGFLGDIESCGIVINSFTELERIYVDYLKEELGHDRVFAVGPLLPLGTEVIERGGPSSNNDVLSWLNTCENQTVVYVCFGSHLVLTNSQMVAVASGLEKSGVKFVWSVKEPTGGHVASECGRIPEGFEDRVAGRGLVVRGWAPQVAILNHDSVGAFLTHCGWNSITEGVVAEVLLLTWPMSADQYSNATLLHDLKVGMKACEGEKTVPDSNVLAKLFIKSVSDESRVERERAKEFAKAAKKAICEKGSSVAELDRLVANVSC
uniref:UDP-glycosyltransferase 89B2-like isoform X2 n=1 Tax=Erigeron canadensis TaxID=72917 RepID=UPI001CB8D7F8|nr:UDP-glycosyltransferase 89B2-like isoform X2 [Erigeron canadensis]